MSFELFVALRYLKAKRKGLFAVVTTLIGVAGVTIGVAALVATLSVMNGFQTDIQKKIIGAQAHVVVSGDFGPGGRARVEAALDREKLALARAPFALGHALGAARGRSTGIVFKGIDPAREFAVNDLGSALTAGDWKELEAGEKDGAWPVMLGEELARSLGVWRGDSVLLISPQSLETPLGPMPRMMRFRVAGTVHTGYYEYDATFAFMSLPAAARFSGVAEPVTSMAVRLRRLGDAPAVAARLEKVLGPGYAVRTFADLNRTLFAALKLEKFVMFTILALIVLVATFNIASNLLLLSTEKARDVGILRALGLSRQGVRRVFVWEGVLIGGTGVACGTLLGVAVSWVLGTFPIVELPPDIYYLSRVPVDIQARDVLAVAATAMAFCVLATLYPAHRAAQVDPVEAIHYG